VLKRHSEEYDRVQGESFITEVRLSVFLKNSVRNSRNSIRMSPCAIWSEYKIPKIKNSNSRLAKRSEVALECKFENQINWLMLEARMRSELNFKSKEINENTSCAYIQIVL